jgi:hypothetical protein
LFWFAILSMMLLLAPWCMRMRTDEADGRERRWNETG